MVSVEELQAFDLLIWLASGQQAAARLDCNQSTIARRVQHCRQTFGLGMRRYRGEWMLQGGEGLLLELEREVHQWHRLMRGQGLRLEGSTFLGELLAAPAPPGWIPGRFDHLGLAVPLRLLQQRIVDAWLTIYRLELADLDPALWTRFDLGSLPWQLTVDARHPLARERGLSHMDLDGFPSLGLPDGLYPRAEALLRERGLWSDPVRLRRYEPACWEGRTADQVTLCYGNSLSLALTPELIPLDWDLQFEGGLCLLVRRDIAAEAAILQLLDHLWRRLRVLASRHPQLQLAA